MDNKFEVGKVYQYTYSGGSPFDIDIRIGDTVTFRIIERIDNCNKRKLTIPDLTGRNMTNGEGYLYKVLQGKQYNPNKSKLDMFSIRSELYRRSLPYDRYDIEQEIKETFNGD